MNLPIKMLPGLGKLPIIPSLLQSCLHLELDVFCWEF